MRAIQTFSFVLSVMCALVAGCGGIPADDPDGQVLADADDGDLPSADIETGDTGDTGIDVPVCLGGLPTAEFRDLSVTPGGVDECTHSPGVTGTPVPVPWEHGGWLIQTHPDIGCTDMDSTRLTWLTPDGSTVVLLEDEVFTMDQERTLPTLFAVTNFGFVLYEVSCTEWHCYDGVWPDNVPKLTARDPDNNQLWAVSATDLGGANGAKLIAVDDEGLWIGLTTVDEDRNSTSRVARIAGSDGAVSIHDIPVGGYLISAIADNDGLLLLMSAQTTIDNSTVDRTLTAVRMDNDGSAGTPALVFSKEYEPAGWTEVTFDLTPLDTGILAGMVEANSEWGDVLSYQDAFINRDGTIRWRHDAGWPNRVAADVWHSHERADGSIEIVNDDLSRYIVIDAGGQSMIPSLMPAGNPLNDGRDWLFCDCYFLDDGVLILAAIWDEQSHIDAVAAMYEPGFTALSWARRYDSSCLDAPRLIRGGDGFILSCTHAVEWPAGDAAYGPMSGRAGTYLYFDSVCD